MDSLIKNEQLLIDTNINSLLPSLSNDPDDDISFCNSIEIYSNSLLLPLLSPNSSSSLSSTSSFFNQENLFSNPPLQPSPAPSAASTNSSLSLSIESVNFNFYPQRSDSYENFSVFINPCNNDQLISQVNGVPYHNWNMVKQDVSVGTDLTITKDLKYKKDFDWMDAFKLTTSQSVRPNQFYTNQIKNDKESFKLVEKIQPKKSRTKYTKEQIDVLESAYWRNAYPDVITIEHLCKSLGISKEKINIWFQNRRARSKRHGV